MNEQVIYRSAITVKPATAMHNGSLMTFWSYRYEIGTDSGRVMLFTGHAGTQRAAEAVAIRRSGRLIERGL
jgi:hypothetical protein